jgi:hypothetical protein
MDTNIWLPFATAVGGWGLAQITESLRDRRTTTRERLARRAELQWTTLLELQDVLLELSRGAVATVTVMLNETSEEEKEQVQWQHLTPASRNLAVTRGRLELLASRVEDERVRELATTSANLSVLIDGEDPKGPHALLGIEDNYSVAIARIGELLRQRY